MFGGVTAADMPALFMQLTLDPRSWPEISRSSLLISRWAQLDPHGGLAFLLNWNGAKEGGEPSARKRDNSIATFLAEWAAVDHPAALEASLALEEKSLRELGCRYVMGALQGTNPEEFFKVAEQLPDDIDINRLKSYTMWNFAGKDLPAALRQLEKMEPEVRMWSTYQLAESWASTDPAAAFDWAQQLENETARTGATHGVLSSWAVNEPWRVAEIFLELEGKTESGTLNGASTIVEPMVRAMSRDDPARALTWVVDNLPTAEGENDVPRYVQDLQAEILRLALVEGGDQTVTAVNRLLSASPSLYIPSFEVPTARIPEVLAKITQLQAPARLAQITGRLFGQWHQADSVAALAEIDRLESPDLRSAAWKAVIYSTPALGDALALMEKIPAAEQAAELSYLLRSSKFEETEIASHLATVESPESHRKLVDGLARRWADSNPTAAIEWASELENPAERGDAWFRIAAVWSEHDFLRSSEWLATVEPGHERDRAIAGLVSNIANLEPAAAVEWASVISDEVQREQDLRGTLSAWYEKSPIEAIDALENLEIPEELRKRLRKQVVPSQ